MKHLNEYRQGLDGLKLPEERKKRLFQAAVQQANILEQRPAKRPVFRTACMVTAVMVVLAACAGKTGILKSAAEAFMPLFGSQDLQIETINQIGIPIGVSDTDNGVTISADAMIGDKNHAWIMYTISWDENTKITLPENIPSSETAYSTMDEKTLLDFESHEYSAQVFTDKDPNDNQIEFVERYGSNDQLRLGTITKEFKNLRYYEQNGYCHSLINGTWKLTFDAAYRDCSVSVPLGDNPTVSYNGIKGTVTSIDVSPIAVQAVIEYPEQVDVRMDVYAVSTTGRKYYAAQHMSGGMELTDKYIWNAGGEFVEIIPIEQIKSVVIGDKEFPVSFDKAKQDKLANQFNLINQLEYAIDPVSAAQNGITVSADSVIGDSSNILAAFTISWDKNTNISIPENIDRLFFENHNCTLGSETSIAAKYWFFDSDPNDNKIQYYEIISRNSQLIPDMISVDLQNLSYYNNSGENVCIAQGHWTFSIPYSGGSSVSLDADGTQSLYLVPLDNGQDITVQHVTVSPVGIFTELKLTNISQQNFQDNMHSYSSNIIVHKTDGTSVSLMLTSCIPSSEQQDMIGQGAVFGEIIPLKEIQSITIGSYTYPMPHN